ncbi:MAG TPA: glycosyltransferase [Ferruginibacter sp.]|nr:glycosyltransferase [Ferruginibacter sp.]HMP19323.1 glycosyltransferase [Ferruginibacter sp.]
MSHELNPAGSGIKILFASFPAHGHFNPLTGLAVHLKAQGYDVRWYTSKSYAVKLKRLDIPHFPFKRTIEITDGDVDAAFPERKKISSPLAKLRFDIINAFILRGPEMFADIQELYTTFKFDLLVADCAFTAIPFVKDIMGIPVISIGVLPLTETSKDLPPGGMGLTPSYTPIGRLRQALLRKIAYWLIFRKPNKVLHQLLDSYNIGHNKESIFDIIVRKSTLLLQSGTPGFEYSRSDISKHVRFIGPLLPHAPAINRQWFDERLNKYERIVLVTQGTVEKDVQKLLVPTLEAFKHSKTLVICTTGGSQTAALKLQYPYSNIIIEDFIPFGDVMPYADAYITNGGYGGVMLGIQNRLPMVVAGVHEGKNEICARVGYFKVGINLKTERPTPKQIRHAVNEIICNTTYLKNAEQLGAEFEQYNPVDLCASYVAALTKANNTIINTGAFMNN